MEPTDNANDAAYMSMLTRNIPGVGNTPLNFTPSKATTTATITFNLNNFIAVEALTDKQRSAIKILQEAQKDTLFVSEGEEPFQYVHINPKQRAAVTTINADNSSSQPPLPTGHEFLKLLETNQVSSDEQEITNAVCEATPDLSTILNKANPGSHKIAKALEDVFHFNANKNGEIQSLKDPKVALYRVILPSSPTRVHLWTLGWVDNHLLGFYTISIES
ncbi:hypothetical protein BX616_011097 [Lobosporangium transversale]|uniref:Uncharacterized protein n=1 Tax=Lobosporangium transversale TaxID=64571 RepID=A0A1Y2GXQ8_9FUNG|nr:hypothetical protein BCR41DRAFT_347381 [Lobosporangium transversale]KAF9909666.1 hypothetical protein BX616_011097 [Lobosporangium transversale]ORZ27079.1 hypothetical protein BCR41DRAFT_347381 [Lobosporangium transversale]|eukprot:XP_021884826.1 hypothetical protein BCR41DRAFT_347381 [Lobosporangium transversale]